MVCRLLLVSIYVVLCFASVRGLSAQDNPPGVRVANLQEQLESGLKARLPREFAFIAVVVARVEERALNVGEVTSVFQWARRKNKKIPFPYFERAMRIIAARKGVVL